MLVVPPGRFLMGSDATPRDASDRPAHQVGVGAGFAVSKLKVSSQAWKECILARLCPSPATGYVASPTQPVVSVSWIDAQQYLAWLTLRSGFEYRLLSEAEWEYVARLGERAGGEVGQQLAGWGEGLEWTSDCWHRDYIGAPPSAESWDDGGDCRLHAVRGWGPGDDRSVTRRLPVLFSTRDPAIGFRVVRSPVE